MRKSRDEVVREYLASIGRKGGKVRAERHSKAELRQWAKLGGRPQKSFNKLSESGKYARKRRAEQSAKEEER
jgi:hypothetical protein